MSEKNFVLDTVWATADEEGGIVAVFKNKTEAKSRLSENEKTGETQVFEGYAVVDQETGETPRECEDFHKDIYDAEYDLYERMLLEKVYQL